MSIQVSRRSYEPNKLHKLQPPIALAEFVNDQIVIKYESFQTIIV